MEKVNSSNVKVCVLPQCPAVVWWKLIACTMITLLTLACFTASHAQSALQTKSGEDSQLTQSDFSNESLSTQQMIAFFKNENSKLVAEINELSENVRSSNTVQEKETTISRVAILKDKLDYLEITMRKWAGQNE